MRLFALIVAICLLILRGVTLAQTTQPGMPPLPPRPALVIERLSDYISQLTLSDEQKTRIQKLFMATRRQMQAARQEQTPPDPRKVQQIVQGLRQGLSDILSAQQLEKMRQLIAEGGPLDGGRGGRRGGAMMDPQMRPDMMGGGPNLGPGEAAAEPDAPMIDIGQPAPDFTLNRLDAQPIKLSAFKGKYVLLVFGSYTSPSFRQRAAQLEQLRRDCDGRVMMFVVYTRENYPVGGWTVERNKDDNIQVEQPKDLKDRQSIAKQMRGVLKLTVPIAIDSMDDLTAKAYGGMTNAAYLIDRDGKVAARQRWFDPYAMHRIIDEATRPAAKPEGARTE